MKTLPFYIGGEFVQGSDISQPIVDPSTGDVIARAGRPTKAEIQRAITAARRAVDTGPWPGMTAQARGRVLFEVARKLRERTAELAELETRNMGKPLTESEFDVAD